MNGLEFSDEPARAFEQTRLWHLVLSSMILTVVFAGELVKWEVGNFNGFVDLGSAAWPVRAFVGFWVAQSAILFLVVTNERRIIQRLMRLDPQRREAVVARALTTTQFLRSYQGIGFACIGLALFFATAEQLDLLVPAAIGIAFAIVTIPKRDHWRAVFVHAASEYPGIDVPSI
jgi:hypothetical protein